MITRGTAMRTTRVAITALAAARLGGPAVRAEVKPPAGFPAPAEVQKPYDAADLSRAVQAYKFFYPTVSMAGLWQGNSDAGIVPNEVFAVLEGNPKQLVFTPNSDTPYAGILLDLTAGPFAVELPPGPFMCAVNDMNQRYVVDLGSPGPGAGKGGRHVTLPPDYKDKVPDGYFAGAAATNRVLVMLRVIPPKGDAKVAVDMMKTIKVRPLDPPADRAEPKWVSLNDAAADFTPLKWETNRGYREALHGVVDEEPAFEAYRGYYGELAALGISRESRSPPTPA